MDKFDVLIIGSGPGGYVAAIRAGQLGLKTAIVEKDKELGGTCLNVGCIPSKALLTSTDHCMFAKKEAEKHGIVIENAHVDLNKMQQRKDKVVKTINSGVRNLVLALLHLVKIDMCIHDHDAVFLGFLFREHEMIGRSQERFARDTTDVQTSAAEFLVFFDNGRL